jgi:hypothetical protein
MILPEKPATFRDHGFDFARRLTPIVPVIRARARDMGFGFQWRLA